MSDLKWTTVQRKINDLIPLEINPRILTPEKEQQLKESIEKFDLVEIPVINTNDELIAGHQRCRMMQIVGRGEEFHDVRIPNRPLTDDEVKEYNIRSNVSIGIWDEDLLKDAFGDMDLSGFGLDTEELETPISEVKVDELDQEEPFDDIPPKDPITQPGDLYLLNGHKLICADSREEAPYKALMGKRKARMIIADPPYNVRIDNVVNLGKTKHKEFEMASGEMTPEEFTDFLGSAISHLVKYSHDGSVHFLFMDWRHIKELMDAGERHYTEFKQLIVWNKSTAGMGSFYRSKHELVFVFQNGKKAPVENFLNDQDLLQLFQGTKSFYQQKHKLVFVYKKGKAKHVNNFMLGQLGRYRTNVWDYPGSNTFSSADQVDDHPTPKEPRMISDAILDCSHPNNIILDNFLGSGTTLISAEQTDRLCYGIELMPGYCDVSVRRWIKYMQDNGREIELIRNNERLDSTHIKEYLDQR